MRLEMMLYKGQKTQAARRGIPFKFTFEQWCSWWETNLGSDWLSKRGRKRNQYVMARNGDKGPYAPHNVRCVLASVNAAEANLGRTKSSVKLTAQLARKIFASEKPNIVLARELDVTVGVIERIKSRSTWANSTEGLSAPPRYKGCRGQQSKNSKLTDEIVLQIRKSSKTRRQLAQEFGVHYLTVVNIKRGKSWKHLL